MKQQLAARVPKNMELSFPRKDVVQLKVHWENFAAFLGWALVALIMTIIAVVLLMSMIGLKFMLVKLVFILISGIAAYLCWHQAEKTRKGYTQIMLTPKEIQKQYYFGQNQGEKKYMRWRDLELFMPVEVARAKEISVIGDQSPRQQLDKALNWQEVGTMRMWVKEKFKHFFNYYSSDQEQYIEQWMQVQYQYYRSHPEVDQLELDYFLNIDEKEAPLLIDLSQHLIDDGK